MPDVTSNKVFASLIPELEVSDLSASLRFYVDTLEFTVRFSQTTRPFVLLEYFDAQLMLEQGGTWITGLLSKPYGRGINLQFQTPKVKFLAERLARSKYELYEPIDEVWYEFDRCQYGARELLIQDPDGYLLRFSEYIGTRSL